MTQWWNSLRFRLCLIVLLGIIPSLLLVSYNYTEYSELTGSLIQEKAFLTAGQVRTGMDLIVETTRQLLTSLAMDPRFVNLDLEACRRIIEDCYGRQPYLFYTNIGIADLEGNILCSAVPNLNKANISDRYYFQQAIKTEEFSRGRFQVGRITGKSSVGFGCPVLDSSGQVRAVLFAGVDLSWFNKLIAAADLPPGSTLTMIDQDGRILSRNVDPQKWTGKTAPEVEIVQACLTKHQGKIEAKGIDGIKKLYGFRPLGHFPEAGYVYVGVPKETFTAASRQMLLKNLIWITLSFGLGLLAVAFFSHVFVMKKAAAVINAARKLSQGDFTARTELTSRDGEIGELGATFDLMAQNLSERDIRRDKAQKQLRQEKELLDMIIESLPGLFYILDREGRMERWNKAVEVLSGYSSAEIAQMNPFGLIDEETRECIQQAVEDAFTGGETFVEALLKSKSGLKIPYLFTGKKIEINGVEHLVGMGLDISALKKAELDLRASEKRYRTVVEDMPALICRFLRDGTLTFVNSAYCSYFNKKEEELVGQNFFQFIPPEEREAVRRHFESLTVENPSITYDHKVWAADGTVRYQQWTDRVLCDEESMPVEYQSVGIDITERKLAEAALYLRDSAIASSISGISILDLEGNVIYVNSAALRLWGYDHERDILGRFGLEFWITKEEAKEAFETAIRTGSWIGELVAKRKDGTRLDLQAAVTLVKDQDGNPIAVMGSYLDISQRKHAEEALKESEARYRLLVENANELICVIQDGRFVFVNSRAMKESGYTFEELLSMHFLDIVHPDDRDVPLMLYQRIMNGEKIEEPTVFRLIDKWGRVRWSHVSVVLVEWNNRPAVMVLGIDITDQKEAEEEVRTSEQMLKGILAACPVGIDMISPDRKLLWANESWRKMFGFESEEEYIGKNIRMVFISQDEYERVRKEWLKQIQEKEVAELDCKFRRKDGTVFDAHVRVTAVDRSDLSKGAIAVVVDISDRIKAEESLKEALERVRKANLESQALLRGTTALLESPMFHDAAKNLLVSCKEPIGATAAYMGLLNKDGTQVETVFLDSGERPCSVDPSLQIHFRGFRAKACLDGKALYENDFMNSKWAELLPGGHVALDNVLFAPLIIDGKAVGILGLANKEGGFNDYDAELAQAFASFASLGLLRTQAMESLKQSEERLDRLIQSSPIGIGIVRSNRYVYVNPALINMMGCSSPEEIVGESPFKFIVPEDRNMVRVREEQRMKGFEALSNYRVGGLKRNGERFEMNFWPTLIDYDGEPALLCFVADVTEETRLRAQLIQAQKMEAIGTLAGGIAHDFNNILTVINGYSELLLAEKAPNDPDYADLTQIRSAGVRGAELVQGLLAFSRKMESRPRLLKLNQQVENVKKLLERAIPKMIAIEIRLADNLQPIHADPTQVEQILMNLTVNARDAMPDGGKLTIETQNVTLDEDYCKTHAEATPGEYVMLSVSDTGHGMDDKTLQHIFEPFFTTKEKGKGTGLGLAMVFGIVKQHAGHITCHSELGRGTTFRIYFPVRQIEASADNIAEPTPPPRGKETILLVDDEDLVRDLGKKMLKRSGYKVLTAANGKEALKIYKQEFDNISLVILDMIMPKMGGRECFIKLRQMNPEVKVLIASGYTSGGTAQIAEELGAKGFIIKPFDMKQLLKTVRAVLDEAQASN